MLEYAGLSLTYSIADTIYDFTSKNLSSAPGGVIITANILTFNVGEVGAAPTHRSNYYLITLMETIPQQQFTGKRLRELMIYEINMICMELDASAYGIPA